MADSDNDLDQADVVRTEIEQTRHELADTVDALADKLNVKVQAQRKIADVQARTAPHRTEIAIGAGVAAAVAIVVVLWRRRRS